MRTIAASQFKAQCLALMDQVAATRQSLVIEKRGKPLVQLMPVASQRAQTPFGVASGGRILVDLAACGRGQ
ncbi:MAG: type II toxin-antitoxin system Phd/YefM family antitoxin [Cyanobacteria bacterium K_DeepCast_35m_m2_155]|nr:type II toxin-antitoxin system Phd/YefM family antitoxin [Cyanobacteria bacterium K_DeepCast_35m_m2_155]